MSVRSQPLKRLRSCRLGPLFACALCALALSSEHSRGQVIVRRGIGGNQSGSFSIRKEDASVAEALADFDRYAGKSEWEKAFAALSKISDVPSKGLIAKDDGFFVPRRRRVREALAALPAAGKQAYRLFNDAKAQRKFAELTGSDTDPRQPARTIDIAQLQDLFDHYFITSIGDQIGDFLGDTLFESGEFSEAAAAWQAILRDFPDPTLAPLRLRSKRAIALLRAGRLDEFQSALDELRQKHTGQSVRIGGRDVDAVALLQEMADQSRSTDSSGNASPATAPSDSPSTDSAIALPSSDEPLWQCVFADDALFKDVNDMMNNNGRWNYAGNPSSLTPRAAVDDHRVYLNWLGIGMAVDAETGKLLWRTTNFTGLPQKLQQSMMNGTDLSGDAIAVAPQAQRVLLTASPITEGPRSRRAGMGQLTCLSAETGKLIWDSNAALSGWTFTSQPLISGDTVYLAACPSGSPTQLNLLAVALADGKLLWQVSLGEASAIPNYRGMATIPSPLLRQRGGMIYVLANSGALLAVNASAHRLDWAFTFGAPVTPQPEVYYSYMQSRALPLFPGSIEFVGSTLLIKDKGDNALYALDVDGPALHWKRPVDGNATIVAGDPSGQSLFALSEELSCIDLNTRAMRWSTKTPIDNGDAGALLAGSHLYLFGSRGVYEVDLGSGERKIFRGFDRTGAGGTVRRVGRLLICVSSRSVTAYPLPKP